MIVDSVAGAGPIVGIRSALAAHPGVAWLVLACDLPFLSDGALSQLLRRARPGGERHGVLERRMMDCPSPCARFGSPRRPRKSMRFWPKARIARENSCCNHAVRLLEPKDRRALDNVNTPEEYHRATSLIAPASGGEPARAHAMQLKIQYFALMREQSGRSEETVETIAATPADLYAELKARYGFTLPREQLKVAVNSRIRSLVAAPGRRRCGGVHTSRGGRLMRFRFTDSSIDTDAARRELLDPGAGGYASFEGWVRNFNEGQEVTRLEYEAFQELALKEGERILAEAAARFPDQARALHPSGGLARLVRYGGVGGGELGASRRGVRCLPLHHRRGQAPRADLEEGALSERRLRVGELRALRGGARHATSTPRHDPRPRSRSRSRCSLTIRGRSCSRKSAPPVRRSSRRAGCSSSGAGGLGSPVLQYLAGAGVGFLGIIDADTLHESNLHRQPIYALAEVGKRESGACRRRGREHQSRGSSRAARRPVRRGQCACRWCAPTTWWWTAATISAPSS